jgi:hypothetical protein
VLPIGMIGMIGILIAARSSGDRRAQLRQRSQGTAMTGNVRVRASRGID